MRTITALLLAAIMTVPAGTATWSAFGSTEPDNAHDDDSYMWTDPPVASNDSMRIYFNGFTANSVGIVSLGANPNVGAVGSRNEVAGIETYLAILGNWVDCNDDGYVGLAESAQREYDAILLTDLDICPASVGAVDAWDGSHNYNGWVTELIPVGTNGGQPSAAPGSNSDDIDGDGIDNDNALDLRILRDQKARVWGDIGLPDDIIDLENGGGSQGCPIRPFPRGTMKSTGGMLDYLDCHIGVLDRWNGLVDAAEDPAGLRFSDADDASSGALGRIETIGEEDSRRAAVVVTDCKADPVFDSSATFNATNGALGNPVGPQDQALLSNFTGFKIFPLAPSTRDLTTPSIAGQLNQTNEEFFDDCDTSNDAGHDAYGLLEADFEATVGSDKRQALFNMEFEDNGLLGNTPRGGVGLGFLDIFGVGQVAFPVHSGTSGATLNNQPGMHDWFARVASVKGPPRTVRTDLAATTPVAPDAARHITYYAFVGEDTLGKGYKVPGPALGTAYGKTQCGGFTSGVHGGWNCDATLWYRNGDGTPQAETHGGMARVGAAYQLRDVDCEDGGNAIGLPTGFPAFGPEACAPFTT